MRTKSLGLLLKLLQVKQSIHSEVKGAWIVLLVYDLACRDSSVGIATRYGLDGPGIEYRCGRDFPHPSRSALGPTQPPVQRVPGLSRG